jgi:DNA polymerase (family 10)
LVALLRVPGLGPKKIKLLNTELAINSLADLRAAAESDRIAKLKGFGAKTQTNILQGIAFLETSGDRILQSTAAALVKPLVEAVKSCDGVKRSAICGSLRRRAETIGDLDILFSADDPAPILQAFVARPEVAQVLGVGPTKASVRLADGVQCDIRGVTDEQFAFALNYFTGSKAHNIALRRRAIARGLKLSEYALEGSDGPIPCNDEAEIYRALELDEIPPELREDTGEIELAEKGALPDLVSLDDLRGTFHCHSDWSDGANTIEQMAQAAKKLGLRYLGLADHSRSAAYAGGLSIERVHEQWAVIETLNQKLGGSIHVFKGIECDILADGTLDYPDELLDGFDYVVASVHSFFSQPRSVMTDRIVRAISHPKVTMLGHPTGRLLLARQGYELDIDAVLEAAARSGTMIEINANPHRLDLDTINTRKARRMGIPIVINPDAHSTAGISDLEFGVNVARRAGLEASDVVNTASYAEIAKRLETMRRRT